MIKGMKEKVYLVPCYEAVYLESNMPPRGIQTAYSLIHPKNNFSFPSHLLFRWHRDRFPILLSFSRYLAQ